MGKETAKSDYQTLSLFLILAILTGIFVLGLKSALLTPDPKRAPAEAELKVPTPSTE